MEQEHLKSGEEPVEEASPSDFIRAARASLRSGRRKDAYSTLLEAAAFYPDHPIILSYRGWLQAAVERRHQSGIASCRKAFLNFRTDDADEAAAVYPVLYLNLGRAFLLAGRKKDAIESFAKGLRFDRGHSELAREIKSLGTRRQPVVSFLSRSNPLNKYLGVLTRHKGKS